MISSYCQLSLRVLHWRCRIEAPIQERFSKSSKKRTYGGPRSRDIVKIKQEVKKTMEHTKKIIFQLNFLSGRQSKIQLLTLCSRENSACQRRFSTGCVKKFKNNVGNEVFRPTNTCPQDKVCGEIRLAIGLRILMGASYLDLIGLAFGVQSIQSIYNYFTTSIQWINNTFSFPLVPILQQLKEGMINNDQQSTNYALEKLNKISTDFGRDSDGIFIGCIGALDGLAIRIKCPSLSKVISDPGNYFWRKNFYALNVQAICDKRKKLLGLVLGIKVHCMIPLHGQRHN